MNCSVCGADNRPEARFCRRCGSPLTLTCPNGHPVAAGDLFCDACGAAVVAPTAGAAAPPRVEGEAGPPAGPGAERRLVSVLFADLVGFTPLSEDRDPEEVRELLSSYFERMRRLVERHGGTIEKFIGDAVMAVWGTPVAHEDDAERAVRAGLAMAEAVDVMNADVGLPPSSLALRVGILSGEAAITVGAEGQGMVAGDLVNTASRIQAAAPSGAVLVGEATKRATESAIAYEGAGDRELRGKAEPVPVWRALRVVAGRRGAGRSGVLEGPFVGRERDLRLVRDLFDASAQERRADLVSVTGIAGIGKSRLSWEFEKYVDGLIERVWWHRGRCLAYGEGVAFWALGEMVRMRAGIAEEEEPGSAAAKLRAAIERHVPDPEERRWIEPRLAHLLGLEDRSSTDREDLFSGWRVFFERLADTQPTVLVFEDLQWADAALLDFIEHLMDWSRNHPMFVLTLARPDLLERRATWGTRGRSFTSLALDPLSDEAMDRLLEGLVPGIPSDLRERIRDRAEGVPLYAVETVRMILDRGLLERDGDRYRAVADIEDLAVPESLHTLIAARLDALPPAERNLVFDASVLGKTFTRPGLAAITGLPEPELDDALDGLVRKELLSLQADPRSPERGQYGFLQGLVKDVAYHTLPKKERRARHLAVARYLDRSWTGDPDEIIEVMASHYVEAYRAMPDAPDTDEIRASARTMLARAGERAASLGASGEAQRHFEQAMEFADDVVERAGLTERAGIEAFAAGDRDAAEQHFDQSIAQFESQGETHAAARVSAHLAEVSWDNGHIEAGIERMERAYEVLAGDEPDADFAALAHQLGRMHFFAGHQEACAERTERALDAAEILGLPEVLSHALNTKSLVLMSRRHFVEAEALLRRALDLALEHDLPLPAFRAYFNLYVTQDVNDIHAFALEGLALARRRGNRQWEANFLGRLAEAKWLLGDWDGAVESERALLEGGERISAFGLSRTLGALAHLHVNRGEVDAAEGLVAMRESARTSAGVIERLDYAVGRTIVARARGEREEAKALVDDVIGAADGLGTAHESIREGALEALEILFDEGDLVGVEALIETLTSQSPPTGYLRVMLTRFRARLLAGRGEAVAADEAFRGATRVLREYGSPFPLAAALVEHAELLVAAGRGDETGPLLTEAREIFERLRAAPWLDRLRRLVESAGIAGRVEPAHQP